MSRVLFLWLATIPPLLVPILFGGVTGLDMISSVVIEFSVALVALGAGVAASAWIKHPLGALLAAEALAALAVSLSAALLYAAYLIQVAPSLALANPARDATDQTPFSLLMGLMPGGGWSGCLGRAGWQPHALWMLTLVEFVLISFLVCAGFVALATVGTRLVWRDSPRSAAQERRRRAWLSPRYWIRGFSREKRQLLDGNPLHWAQQHSTWARLSILAWCGLIMFVDSALLLRARAWEGYDTAQFGLSIALAVHMTFASVTFFRGPRESGALELLLVSSMGVGPLIRLALAGFWRRFLTPAILLILLSQVLVWQETFSPYGSNTIWYLMTSFLSIGQTGLAAIGLLTIPATGMYASLQFRSFTAAFLFTGGFALVLPLFCGTLGQVVQVLVALGACYGLAQTLTERTFATQQQLT